MEEKLTEVHRLVLLKDLKRQSSYLVDYLFGVTLSEPKFKILILMLSVMISNSAATLTMFSTFISLG